MDMNRLLNPVKNTRMPGDVRLRLIESCRESQREKISLFPRTAIIALVALLLAGIAAWASVNTGYFRDIKNAFGAVTGTEYLAADREILIEANAAGNTLHIHASFLLPDEFPYREVASLSLSGWKISDASGKILFEGNESTAYPVSEGASEIVIPLPGSCPDGCTLTVNDFFAHKKADQPLRIQGTWRCAVAKPEQQ